MASSYSNLHPVDQILTSLVVEAVPSDSQLIANDIFENIKVPERSGTILLEESRNFMGAGAGLDLERAPGASRATIGGFDRTSQTFKARIYAASDSIAMEDIFDSQYPRHLGNFWRAYALSLPWGEINFIHLILN